MEFADFKTAEGILRVGGNDKVFFTRERQPKEVVVLIKNGVSPFKENYNVARKKVMTYG